MRFGLERGSVNVYRVTLKVNIQGKLHGGVITLKGVFEGCFGEWEGKGRLS